MEHLYGYVSNPLIIGIDVFLFICICVCIGFAIVLRQRVNTLIELFQRILDKAQQNKKQRRAG